jgi:uncharacterized protein YdhG (YjbR/CyaY superfamily)
MGSTKPHAANAAVTAYIDGAPEPARGRLRALAEVIRAAAPDAEERIAYGLVTWRTQENLIHLGAFTHHVGVYPGAAAIVFFADELAEFKSTKGAIRIPHDAPLPTALVRRLTSWRLKQAATKGATATPKQRTAARAGGAANASIVAYNASTSGTQRALCGALADHIARALPAAEARVWHGHPAWFVEGKPVVGYRAGEDATRLLFWHGQFFDEPALSPVGKLHAAEVRYYSLTDVRVNDLRRWLRKAQATWGDDTRPGRDTSRARRGGRGRRASERNRIRRARCRRRGVHWRALNGGAQQV